jgi:hypothetical protein
MDMSLIQESMKILGTGLMVGIVIGIVAAGVAGRGGTPP